MSLWHQWIKPRFLVTGLLLAGLASACSMSHYSYDQMNQLAPRSGSVTDAGNPSVLPTNGPDGQPLGTRYVVNGICGKLSSCFARPVVECENGVALNTDMESFLSVAGTSSGVSYLQIMRNEYIGA